MEYLYLSVKIQLFVKKGKPARECNNSSQFMIGVKSSIEREGSTLTESSYHDSISRNSSLQLLSNYEINNLGGFLDSCLIFFASRIQRQKIKPGRHLETRI